MSDLGNQVNTAMNVYRGEFFRNMLRRDPVSDEVISSIVIPPTVPLPKNMPLGSGNNYVPIPSQANEYWHRVLNPNGNAPANYKEGDENTQYYKEGDENTQYAPPCSDFLDTLYSPYGDKV